MSKRDDDDNVIPVDFSKGERTTEPLTRLRPRRKPHPSFTRVVVGGAVVTCGHPSVEIDEDTLDLACSDCKAPIDARLFVLEWARRERQLEWARDKVTALNKEYAELERKVRNLKAQIRRAEKKAPPP